MYKEWFDVLSGDVMQLFFKGVVVVNELLFWMMGFVKGVLGQFDWLFIFVGGVISTFGFDVFVNWFEWFIIDIFDSGIDWLMVFFVKLQGGEYSGGQLREWFDYVQQVGLMVFDIFENVVDVLLYVFEVGQGVGMGVFEIVNVFIVIVLVVLFEVIVMLLQLVVVVKVVKLVVVGVSVVQVGFVVFGVQIGVMWVVVVGMFGVLVGVGVVIIGLFCMVKIVMVGIGLGLLLMGFDWLVSKSACLKLDVDKLLMFFIEFVYLGKVFGEVLRVYGLDFDGFVLSLQWVIDFEGFDQVQQSIVLFFGMDFMLVKDVKVDVDVFDQVFVDLVQNGQVDFVVVVFDWIVKCMEVQGFMFDEICGQFDVYKDVFVGQCLICIWLGICMIC